MRLLRFSILVLLLVGGALFAIGSPGSAENEGASVSATPEAAESEARGSSSAAEGTEGAGEPPLDTFVPSERLPADSAISFPVDI